METTSITKKKTTVKKRQIAKKAKKVAHVAANKVAPEAIVEASKSGFSGFIEFIRTQGVVGLAVGLVLGSSMSAMVKSLVDDIIMPPLGILLGSAEGLAGLALTIHHTPSGAPVIIKYGIFLNDFVNFIVIAFVLYLIIKFLRLDKFDTQKASITIKR